MHAGLTPCDLTADPNVLLIESNPVTAYHITHLLAQSRDAYAVSAVSSVQDAFRTLDERPYDAVVFDAQSASVKAIGPILLRLHQRLGDAPLVVLTTCAQEQWAVRALQAGATQVLVRSSTMLPDVARVLGVALERQRMAVRLRQQASRDRLTQLANRNALSQAIEEASVQCMQRRGRFAVMLVDLDGFKSVNDTLGHDGGDHVLRHVATRLRQRVQRGDVVARVGGDEFALLINDVGSLWRPLELADRLVAAVCRDIEVNGTRVKLGCRIGIALYPQSGRTEAELMKAADLAMYAAKGSASAIRLHLPDGVPQWAPRSGNTPTPPERSTHPQSGFQEAS